MPFLVNLGHLSQNHQYGEGNPYRLLFPSSKNLESYMRSDKLEENDLHILFDPQIYLATVERERTGKLCGKLATYPWFPAQTEEYDSGTTTVRNWMNEVEDELEWEPQLPQDEEWIRESITKTIEFQRSIKCYRYILPSPMLTGTAEESLEQYLKWMELGAEVASELSIESPLHSLPISDYLLEGPNSQILQSVLDNLVTAGDSGLYLTVIRSSNGEKRLVDRTAVASCLYMSMKMADLGKELWVNGLDDLGYLCVAAGATGFASGPYNKQRRICFQDFGPGGGRQLPRFYSHELVGDFYSQRDLIRFHGHHLTRLLKNDTTEASQDLHKWLNSLAKTPPNTQLPEIPPPWRETPNNVTASHSHRLQLLQKRTHELEHLDRQQRLDQGLTWLQNSVANSALIQHKLGVGNLDEDFLHLEIWLAALESVMPTDNSIWEYSNTQNT